METWEFERAHSERLVRDADSYHIYKGNYPLTVERNYESIGSCSAKIVNLPRAVRLRNHAAL
jgi:hypothetical protein